VAAKRRTKRPMEPAYSGPASKTFWRRVNALPATSYDELYHCCILLQNMEETVLRWLNEAERKAVPDGR